MPNHEFRTDKLSELHNDTLINETVLAELLGVSTRTIKRMVRNGHLPNHFKLGGYSCWIVGDIKKFFHERATNAQEEAEAKEEEEQVILERYLP